MEIPGLTLLTVYARSQRCIYWSLYPTTTPFMTDMLTTYIGSNSVFGDVLLYQLHHCSNYVPVSGRWLHCFGACNQQDPSLFWPVRHCSRRSFVQDRLLCRD